MQQQVLSMSSRARRELIAQMAPRYREASLARKRTMLDSLVEMTGYARKYAIGLLNRETPGPPIIRRPRQSRYGSEIQQALFVAYCEREHLTFTRGRPKVTNDQCRIEQKKRAVVRSFVGHDRLEGSHASQQLSELYRALRLYVNCFQPSMKR